MNWATLRRRLHTQLDPRLGPSGRLSDLNRILVFIIVIAVGCAIAETEEELTRGHAAFFFLENLTFGSIFLVEYVARLWTVAEVDPGRPFMARLKFALSLAGLVDLVTVLSSLLPIIAFNSMPLRIIRIVRIVRLARLGRISLAIRYISEAVASRRDELFVTLAIAVVILLVGSTALYWIEGSVQPDKFGSIPRAMWWSVVTLTTIGYGDVYPITPLGKAVAAIVAMAGVGVIALPAGILAAAFSDAVQRRRHDRHDKDN